MLAPLFETMSPQECEDILMRAHVGRLAFTSDDVVDVVPVGLGVIDRLKDTVPG